jgi:hypothetical protein
VIGTTLTPEAVKKTSTSANLFERTRPLTPNGKHGFVDRDRRGDGTGGCFEAIGQCSGIRFPRDDRDDGGRIDEHHSSFRLS